MKSKKELIEVLTEYASLPYREKLINSIEPSIRFKTTKKGSNKIGATKLGGIPDLPNEMRWFRNPKSNIPYTFVGQMNLEEIKSFDSNNFLPNHGMLYFFFNMHSWDEGKVIFQENIQNFYQPEIPVELYPPKKTFFQKLFNLTPQGFVLKECAVEIFQDYRVPPWDSLKVLKILKEVGITSSIFKANLYSHEDIYEKALLEDENEALISKHLMLGHYEGVQHSYVELGLSQISTKEKELSIEEIDNALEWKLLFQIDSDSNLDISWGDWGRIYFFIKQEDLKNRNFENVKTYGDTH